MHLTEILEMPFTCSFPDSLNLDVITHVHAADHQVSGTTNSNDDDMFTIAQVELNGNTRTHPVCDNLHSCLY